jgi:adenylate cyclase
MDEGNRRLAGILAADIVSYSRLLSADEPGTLRRVRTLRVEIIEPIAQSHGGRIFKTTGDGFLAAFASAVQAVRAAIAIQQAVRERDDGLRLRIGVHQGEVVSEGEDFLGDGVIIASRLESLADPGGICISGRVREDAAGKMALEVEDLGTPTLKNIAQPISVFRVRLDAQVAPPELAFLQPRLSIVVLPFELLGGDPADGYLADGITEDLTTDLSHVPGTFVIARGSAYSYRGKATDIRRIGAELGVRYAVMGSVRRLGTMLRVNAQLISTESGAQLWSDRFDQPISDLAGGQDQIIIRLRAALAIGLTDIEARRSARERPSNPDAFDLIMRARAERFRPESPDTLAEAARLFELALQHDPNSIEALTGASDALAESSLVHDTIDSLERAAQYLERARRLEPNAEQVLRARVFLMRVQERWSELPEVAERLIESYPNAETGYNHLALVRIYQGRLEEAIPLLEASMRLSPRNPVIYFRQWRMAYVMVLLGRDEEAIAWAKRAANPGPTARWRGTMFLVQAAANARMGDLLAARRALSEAHRLWPLDTVRTRYLEGPASPAHKALYARYQDALRLVGYRDHAEPDADYGVPSDDRLHGDLVGLTPTTAPHVTTIRTTELETLLAERNALVVDTMLYSWGHSIPGAVGLAGSGRGGELSGPMTERLGRMLHEMTEGDLSAPIVAMGWNSERFDGRNLALRMAALGYKQVYWFRGGREAWEVAGLPEADLAPQDW